MRISARKALAFVLTVVAVGCADSTTQPLQDDFDVGAALLDYAALDRVLRSDALVQLETVGRRISGEDLLADPGKGGPAGVPIISEQARGSTFVYDPETDRYRRDAARTGAPPNGVRFILYAPDAIGRPDVTAETGHADLLDMGGALPRSLSLRFVVTVDGIQRMDYTVTAGGSERAGAVGVAGFLRAERDVLAFNIVAQGRRDGETEVSEARFVVSMDERGFRATATQTGSNGPAGGVGEIELAVQHGQQSITVALSGSEAAVSGVFTVNGRVLASVSGLPESPVFLGVGGDPLGPDELRVLGHVMRLQGQVFDLFQTLMEPAADLIALGIGL